MRERIEALLLGLALFGAWLGLSSEGTLSLLLAITCELSLLVVATSAITRKEQEHENDDIQRMV